MKPSELLTKHLSDKTSHHRYGDLYDQLLGNLTSVTSVLEIGIMHGQSLRAWEELFQDAQIIGMDNDASRQVNAGRIRSIHCDTTERAKFLSICESLPEFDIIIDDASHVPCEQVWAFACLFGRLKKGGLYIIEDIPDPKYFTLFKNLGATCHDLRRLGGCADDLVAVIEK